MFQESSTPGEGNTTASDKPQETNGVRDKLIAAVKEARPSERRALFTAFVERYGREAVEAELLLSLSTGSLDPFARGLCQADDLPESQTKKRIWWGLYPGTVAYLIGETGVGKTTLLRHLSRCAALNESLFGIEYELGRAANVLHLDPENMGNVDDGNGGNTRAGLDRISPDRPASLVYHDGADLDLGNAQHMARFSDLLTNPNRYLSKWGSRGKIDLAIIDPMANCYAVQDENNNAEAAARIKALKKCAMQTNTCLLLIHHESAKSNKDGTAFYGRGATATLAGVDTAFLVRAKENLDETSDDYKGGHGIPRTGLVRWQLTKNRLGGRGSVYLEMCGWDLFERRDWEAWRDATAKGGDAGLSKLDKCAAEIEIMLTDGRYHAYPHIVAAMGREGFTALLVRNALRMMADKQQVTSQQSGHDREFALKEIREAERAYNAPSNGRRAYSGLSNRQGGGQGQGASTYRGQAGQTPVNRPPLTMPTQSPSASGHPLPPIVFENAIDDAQNGHGQGGGALL